MKRAILASVLLLYGTHAEQTCMAPTESELPPIESKLHPGHIRTEAHTLPMLPTLASTLPKSGNHPKNSLEEYEANPGRFVRRNITFGSLLTNRIRLAHRMGLLDPRGICDHSPNCVPDGPMKNTQTEEINVRKLKDGPDDFLKYTFRKVNMFEHVEGAPFQGSWFDALKDLHKEIREAPTSVRRPNWPEREERVRMTGEHALEHLLMQEVIEGTQPKEKIRQARAGETNDDRINRLFDEYARTRLMHPDGPQDVFATKNNDHGMKMWMHYPHRHSQIRTSRKYKPKTKYDTQYGVPLVHSLGMWTNPGFWEFFRNDMMRELGSTRYELPEFDYINWSQFSRDFHSGLVEYTNMWVPVEHFNCRPLVVADKRSQGDDHTYSETRYPGALLAGFGVHMIAYHTKFDNDIDWYIFDADHWKYGDAIIWNALDNMHTSVPGFNEDESDNMACTDEDTIRCSYDVKAITINVDMNDIEPAVEWLRTLHNRAAQQLFKTDDEARAYIHRHWARIQQL